MRVIQILRINDGPLGGQTIDLRLPAVPVVSVEVFVVHTDAPFADAHSLERLILDNVQLMKHARYLWETLPLDDFVVAQLGLGSLAELDKLTVLVDHENFVLLRDLLDPAVLFIGEVLIHHFSPRIQFEGNDTVRCHLVDLFAPPTSIWLDEEFDYFGARLAFWALDTVDCIVEPDLHVYIMHETFLYKSFIEAIFHVEQDLLVCLDDEAVRVPRAINKSGLTDKVGLLDDLNLLD